MDKSGFKKVAVLVSVSLLLLAILQVVWFVRSYRDLNEQFHRKVSSALEKSAYDELISRETQSSRTAGTAVSFASRGNQDSVRMITEYGLDSTLANYLPYDSLHRIIPDSILNMSVNRVNTDSARVTISVRGAGDSTRYLTILNMQVRGTFPLRVHVERSDSLLRENLLLADIDLPYRFSLIDKENDREIFGYGETDIPKAVTFELPTDRLGRSAYRLEIRNPNRMFFRSMGLLILSSLAIIGLLVFSFIYLLRTLFRQKDLERMRLDFTHNITHELKTPISVASAANEALLSFGAYDDPVRRENYLKVVDDQLDNLSGMVEKILSMSLYDEGNFTLHRENLPLRPLLEELLKEVVLKNNKQIRTTLEVVPNELTVTADPFHLRNMLSNLLDNAVKYAKEEVRITVVAGLTGDSTEIRIRDNGIGMGASELKRIYDKFYRVPTGNRHDVKGFGLGLYYVRTMIEKHGGTVTVESSPGNGSVFTLKFPSHGE